jgi:peptide/nickel transport system substrate-binding protein
MLQLRRLRPFHVLSVLAGLALLVGCAAPAASPGAAPAAGDTTSAEAPADTASTGSTSDLPAEPGRGTDGTLTILYWQAVSIVNPYLSTGTKDYLAGSFVLEPLVEYNPEGELRPVLVTEVPTVENGGISEDLTSVTYTLLDGVVWSDGTPLTAADVVFTWQYCTEPATGCSSLGAFEGVTNVEAVDDQTVVITFSQPTPFPYNAFGGYLAPVLQAAQFADCVGAVAQTCAEQNAKPIGTGPYVVSEFLANDTVVYTLNENYRVENKPHFAEVIVKGGGDAPSAARAVLETNEADYAWNVQVEPAILNEMAAAGLGSVSAGFAANVERIVINFTNPDPSLGELRSEWTMDDPNPHPFLSDPLVRQALSMAIDRTVVSDQLYGAAGRPTCNILAGPPAVVSTTFDDCLTQDLEGAAALLEEAGWVDSNGDGVREKDGVELRILFQTSTNAVRQKTQALVQQWWQEIGVATELKNIDAAVFFGADVASPDTLGKFYADVQMYTNGPSSPDPQSFLSSWRCNEGANIASTANNWLSDNVNRWCSPEFDALHDQLIASVDPEERAALAKELNDLLIGENVILPLVFRSSPSAVSNSIDIGGDVNGWDSEHWNQEDWYRVRN